GSWSLLPLLVAQHVRPDIDLVYAGNVAIAIECLVCALDLVDDVEDSDATPIVDALGTARVLNVSTTLLMLAQKAIVSLEQMGIASDTVVRLLDTMQEAVIVATVGQHRDLLAEHRPAQDLTFEECIEIAAGKGGSLMRLACRIGALCADANTLLVEQFSELGKLLGISYQLDNDSHDMYYLLQTQHLVSGDTGKESLFLSRKTDLIRNKKTLPVVLAAQKKDTLQEQSLVADEKNEEYVRALHEGIIMTWGISLLYRERAHDCLRKIEEQQAIAPTLKLLLGFE
ncbi:MAG: polyprenyl synthetase family protein, partial [Chloroflexota bacterium]|nr:polyprenyl synthetase family protein [Chloroflexota bacterium]